MKIKPSSARKFMTKAIGQRADDWTSRGWEMEPRSVLVGGGGGGGGEGAGLVPIWAKEN